MRGRRRLEALTIAMALVLVFAGLRPRILRAFGFTGAAFSSPSASFLVNPSFLDVEAGSSADQVAALRSAAETWRDQGRSNFSFGYGGTTQISAVAPDGVNTVRYSHSDGNGALAVCFWWEVAGETTDFDIVFYDRDGGYDFVWTHQNPTANGQFDIRSVAVHEFGHALGLAHSQVSGAALWPTINPGTTSGRDLHQDDIDGVRALYGALPSPSIQSVTPDHLWVGGGGGAVTISGSGLSYVNDVRFGGASASLIQVIDDQTLSCWPPPGLHGDPVDVRVDDGLSNDVLVGGFRYDTARCTGPLVFDVPTAIEVMVPADANRPFYGFVSAGQAGIPLSNWGDPLDPRVLPLSEDLLFWYSVWNVEQHYPWFGNNYGLLDAQGRGSFDFTMPTVAGAEGLVLHFCFVVGGPGELSGIRTITNASSGVVTLP